MVEQIGMVTSLGEEKFWIKTPLKKKTTLCHILFIQRGRLIEQ